MKNQVQNTLVKKWTLVKRNKNIFSQLLGLFKMFLILKNKKIISRLLFHIHRLSSFFSTKLLTNIAHLVQYCKNWHKISWINYFCGESNYNSRLSNQLTLNRKKNINCQPDLVDEMIICKHYYLIVFFLTHLLILIKNSTSNYEISLR